MDDVLLDTLARTLDDASEYDWKHSSVQYKARRRAEILKLLAVTGEDGEPLLTQTDAVEYAVSYQPSGIVSRPMSRGACKLEIKDLQRTGPNDSYIVHRFVSAWRSSVAVRDGV